jgi:hypothetical protein
MLEAEQPEGLSSRKLVVETAKHNVLTAYSAENGLNLLRRFPNVDVVLVHEALLEEHPGLFEEIRKECAKVPIILASPFARTRRDGCDYFVDSLHPQALLTLLNEELGGEQRE